jgi:hypothetical protein
VEWIPPSFDLSKDLRIFQSCHGGLPCDLLIVPFIYHAITEFTSSHNGFGSRGRLGPVPGTGGTDSAIGLQGG